MKLRTVGLLGLCLLLIATIGNAQPAEDNKASAYTIFTGAGASSETLNAATELSVYLGRVAGTRFTAVTGRPAGAGRLIAVGPEAAKLLQPQLALDLKTLKHDGIRLLTLPDGNLILTGAAGASRGTLNAVYVFLENYCGCRWWDNQAETIPNRPQLTIPSINLAYVPPFEYRDLALPFRGASMFSVRNRLNGSFTSLPAGYGNNILYPAGFVHTFYAHVPPADNFPTHPEWYSWSNLTKKRFSTDELTNLPGQLCLTNSDLLHFYRKKVAGYLSKAQGETIISVSQNDMGIPCECERCLAENLAAGKSRIPADQLPQGPKYNLMAADSATIGRPSGPLLKFVNAIAANIARDYPEAAIDTLAYRYTRQAPENVKAVDNVIVRLCSIECSFSHPFSHPENQAFFHDLQQWSKTCKRLYIWDYTANFCHLIFPFPNLRVLGPNMKILRDNGVKGVFMQGHTPTRNGEFSALRAWMLAKLLWNPDMDAEPLIKEFTAGYYGAAGSDIQSYIDLIHRNLEKSGQPLSIYQFDTLNTPYSDVATMLAADRLFALALAAVAASPELTARVEIAYTPVLYTIINNYSRFRDYAADRQVKVAGRQEYFKRLVRIGNAAPIDRISEFGGPMGDFNAWAKAMSFWLDPIPAPRPECFKGVPDDRYREIAADRLTIIGAPLFCRQVCDPQSPGHSVVGIVPANAALFVPEQPAWFISGDLKVNDERPRQVYVEAKVLTKGMMTYYTDISGPKKLTGAPQTGLTWRLQENAKTVVAGTEPYRVADDGNYRLYDLGKFSLKGRTLEFKASDKAEIYLSRIIIVE